MEYIHVKMVCENLGNVPEFELPEGYSFRKFREGDQIIWADIETAVGQFKNREQALEYFKEEFGTDYVEMEKRCFFLQSENGNVVGTATAWFNGSFQGENYGRLHWVAIHPDFQGKGLARPLISKALQYLAESYLKAYLTSQTTSYKAIKLYLDFGFIPLEGTPGYDEAWGLIASLIKHPLLEKYCE